MSNSRSGSLALSAGILASIPSAINNSRVPFATASQINRATSFGSMPLSMFTSLVPRAEPSALSALRDTLVRTDPGVTTRTLTPCPATSLRSASAYPISPCFAAQYAVRSGIPAFPATLEIMTSCPEPRASKCGNSACVSAIGASRSTPTIR